MHEYLMSKLWMITVFTHSVQRLQMLRCKIEKIRKMSKKRFNVSIFLYRVDEIRRKYKNLNEIMASFFYQIFNKRAA